MKPFASFKPNVPVAYAWEPVLVKAIRKPVVTHRLTLRDWVSENITLRKGLVGVKPEAVSKKSRNKPFELHNECLIGASRDFAEFSKPQTCN